MALDWSKQITFTGLRKRTPRAKAEYPSKTSINLMVRDKTQIDVRKSLPMVILTVLVVIFVCKFGIFDFYDRVNQKQGELSSITHELSDLEAALVDYSAVKAEYDTYESSKLVADESTVSAIDALELVDKYVRPSARVQTMDLKGNTVSLNLAGVSLDGVGKLVSTLYEQPIVANVSVSTAGTGKTDASDTTAVMTITLKRA